MQSKDNNLMKLKLIIIVVIVLCLLLNQYFNAIFGNKTTKAVEDRGLIVNIGAPTPEVPSMTMAIENYIKENK